ncbi:MAG: FIST C-terminal domain-containing protein [Rhodoferax sp.]|nr:FIST C-terminal domain-containing protein [Rhodoferax sp.]
MITTASSLNPDTTQAVAELAGKLTSNNPALVVVFFSARHAASEVARLVQAAWPQAHSIGCSSSGEITNGAMTDGGMVAMLIDTATLPAMRIALVDDMGNPERVDAACQALGDILQGDYDQHIGIVLMDGMSGMEEKVMDRLGDVTDLRFIGGSAGDDLAFKATQVFADGVAYSNAAVLAVLQVPAGYRIIKTQSFVCAGKKLIPTKVDAAKREVLEFDGKPALQAYAQAVQAANAEEAAAHFMSNPVGLMDGNDPYVRSPQMFDGDALKFYCAVSPGVELELLQSTDIIADTAQALAQTNADGKVVGILNFHCILRTLELKAKNQTQAYADLFTLPTVGFSTYGEADIGHINQTSTMIALLG